MHTYYYDVFCIRIKSGVKGREILIELNVIVKIFFMFLYINIFVFYKFIIKDKVSIIFCLLFKNIFYKVRVIIIYI